MKIAIIGSGYVGLVAGACFADSGNDVYCVDIDNKKIENLKKGIIPIYEPGLEILVKRNFKEGRLVFTTNMQKSVEESDIIFIAVGTPPDEDGSADLSHVIDVAEKIGTYMNSSKIVVDKSTVPVGTAQKVKKKIQEVLDNRNFKDELLKFSVVSNPEFLKEGDAINDFLKPDRVVLGVDEEEPKKILKELYEPFVRTGSPIIFMSVKSAEMTKYAANSMLATRISFMNELSRLCEKVGADIHDVRVGIGSDKRIGNAFLFPGCGYGGSCFPKDVKAIIKTAHENNMNLNLLESVEKVNNEQKKILFDKILKHYNDNLVNKVFGIWGLSFKPKTDDMREAPSIVIIENIIEKGGKVKIFDPEAMIEARRIFGNNSSIMYCDHMYEVCKDSDSLVLVTEWMEFRSPDFNKIKELLKEPVIFDGRNQYDLLKMKELGIKYYCIGRMLGDINGD